APPLGAAVLPPAPVPLHQVAALPPANDQAPAVAPLLPSRAPTVVVAQAPEASGPQGLTDDMAALDAMSRAGDIASAIELICRWIDDAAEAVRGTATTASPGQTLEYEQIRREVSDLAYGQVQATPSECPYMWASVGVDVAKTGDDAADIRA